jgi:hypothetical protein
LAPEERPLIAPLLQDPWLRDDLNAQVVGYAITHLVPNHLDEIRRSREELADKTKAAVKERPGFARGGGVLLRILLPCTLFPAG